MKQVTCPSCKSERVGIVERVYAICQVTGFDDDGTPEYEGNTEVFYEDAKQQIDEETGRLILGCLSCGAEFTVEGV